MGCHMVSRRLGPRYGDPKKTCALSFAKTVEFIPRLSPQDFVRRDQIPGAAGCGLGDQYAVDGCLATSLKIAHSRRPKS